MSVSTNRYNARRVAFELWCIQQDLCETQQPVGGLGRLIAVLRERHPQLKESVIDRAVDLFLYRLFEDNQARIIRHREWILKAGLPLMRTRCGELQRPNDGCVYSRSPSNQMRRLHESDNMPL